MKLLTKELEKKLEKFPLYSQDGKGLDAKVLAKYFSPLSSHIWYVLEGTKLNNNDYEFYTYCSTGDRTMSEYGYTTLSQLEEIKFPYGMGIERDMYSKMKSLGEMLKEDGRINELETI